tara:strand:+ start:131 stop:1591 length:1461 start_codon:yes stop_codon:yes gene_type:complete
MDIRTHFNKEVKRDNIIHTYDLENPKCNESRKLADTQNRDFIRRECVNTDLAMIEAPAGSGKTTLVLDCIKIHKNKKFLYIVYNRIMKEEFKKKREKEKITNVDVRTFDGLCYVHVQEKTKLQILTNPQTFYMKNIHNILPQLKGYSINDRSKVWEFIKRYFKSNTYNTFSDIVHDTEPNELNVLGKNPIEFLEDIWNTILAQRYRTFEIIRKEAIIYNLTDYINNNFDIIACDEVQDCDIFMVDILLSSITITRLLIGDSLQSIYGFRKCVNIFNINNYDKYPILLQAVRRRLYITFRFGELLSNHLNEEVPNCNIISSPICKSKIITSYPKSNYIHICKTWKSLLCKATDMTNIYIYGWSNKKKQLQARHRSLLMNAAVTNNENEEDDGLSKFLLEMNPNELKNLIEKIDTNSVSKTKAKISFATIHATKGLEFENVVIDTDIVEKNTKMIKDPDYITKHFIFYYTSLTRAKKSVYIMSKYRVY